MTGTSRFERNGMMISDLSLLQPIKGLAESPEVSVEVSQYYFDHPLFDTYERQTGMTTWDLDGLASAVPSGGSVLDVGCGDGRALVHLARETKLESGAGIDTSEIALSRMRQTIAQDAALQGRVQAVHCNVFDELPDEINRPYDFIFLADCTVNFFIEADIVTQLLLRIRSLLSSGPSRIALAVFDDGAPRGLTAIDGRCSAVTFRDDSGEAHVIWWSHAFDADTEILHRSVFLQKREQPTGGKVEAIVCDLYDHLWTPSSLAGSISAAGLTVTQKIPGAVASGAAKGFGTCVLILEAD